MMNTTVSQPLLNHHFLTVCQYITSFGIFFNNQGLLAIDDENDTVLVLNTLFDYLRKSQNESAAKLQLVKSALERNLPSDGRNETFDMKYVNDTFWYIISKSLFHQHENIDNYLTSLVDVIDKEWDEFYPQIKETVLENLLKTKAKNCSSKSKTTKTTSLIIEQVFEKYILPNLEKRTNLDISRKELFNVTRKYLKRSKRSDEEVEKKQVKFVTGVTDERQNILQLLRHSTWKELTRDAEVIKKMRLLLNKLAYSQVDKKWLFTPLHLRFISITKSKAILEFLLNLKGHSFAFNDITLMKNEFHTAPQSKDNDNPFNFIIYYNCRIESQYGFLDLNSFGDNSVHNTYATFSDVFFTITSTELVPRYNGGTDLHIQLEQQPLTKEKWKIHRHRNFKILFAVNEIINLIRLQEIHKLANVISSQVPLCSLTTATELLKSYILKFEESMSHVPTYATFTNEYINTLQIKDSYRKFWFKNEKYIDDVLYEKILDNIDDLNVAVRKVAKLYNENNERHIGEIFNKYKVLTLTRYYLRFEDYYLINTKLTHYNNNEDLKKINIAISRLALRQSFMEPINHQLILYHTDRVNKTMYEYYRRLERGEIFKFDTLVKLTSNETEVEKELNPIPRLKTILFKINLKNPTGMVNMEGFLISPDPIYIPYFSMNFDVISARDETINNYSVLVIKLVAFGGAKEDVMIEIINELGKNDLTEFYID
ncbi:uncharacterized protein LOC122502803 [Leptopilina heterotoma]|uniref:uncharacterized protein LOC122502803 n=1 Tax=Leptopilina heterotoma TaxID=63436 RepID=UPI001CA9CAF2|nr:uncharacterized protein LOC122502803 [Leptopilina heterotoma]